MKKSTSLDKLYALHDNLPSHHVGPFFDVQDVTWFPDGLFETYGFISTAPESGSNEKFHVYIVSRRWGNIIVVGIELPLEEARRQLKKHLGVRKLGDASKAIEAERKSWKK